MSPHPELGRELRADQLRPGQIVALGREGYYVTLNVAHVDADIVGFASPSGLGVILFRRPDGTLGDTRGQVELREWLDPEAAQ